MRIMLHISNHIDLLTVRLSPGVCIQLSSETAQCIRHMYIGFNPLVAALLLLPVFITLALISIRKG